MSKEVKRGIGTLFDDCVTMLWLGLPYWGSCMEGQLLYLYIVWACCHGKMEWRTDSPFNFLGLEWKNYLLWLNIGLSLRYTKYMQLNVKTTCKRIFVFVSRFVFVLSNFLASICFYDDPDTEFSHLCNFSLHLSFESQLVFESLSKHDSGNTVWKLSYHLQFCKLLL